MPLPTATPVTICCEMVKDTPSLYVLVILLFLALAAIAITGFIALLLD